MSEGKPKAGEMHPVDKSLYGLHTTIARFCKERNQAQAALRELLEAITAHRAALARHAQPLNTTAQIQADRELHSTADRIAKARALLGEKP